MVGENYYLFVKNGQSLYAAEVEKEILLKKQFGDNHTIINRSVVQSYSEIISTDNNEKKRISKITTGGNSYNIQEPLLRQEWKKSDTLKTINRYKCKLAETKFYDKTIKAWYTESINLPYETS